MRKFRCHQCDQKIGVPDEWGGHAVRCPRCKQAINVPEVIDVPVRRVAVFAETKVAPLPTPPPPPFVAAEVKAEPEPTVTAKSSEPIITQAADADFSSLFAQPDAAAGAPARSGANLPADAAVGLPPDSESSEEAARSAALDAFHDNMSRAEIGVPSASVEELLRGLGGEAPQSTPIERGESVEEIPESAAARSDRDASKWAGPLASIALLVGVAGLALCVAPTLTRWALPAAAAGLVLALVAAAAPSRRIGKALAVALGACTVSTVALVLAILVSMGFLPGATAHGTPRALVARDADVEVRVTSAKVLRPVVYGGDGKSTRTAATPCLQIALVVRPIAKSRPLAYRTWGRLEDGHDPAVLTDNDGNPLKLIESTARAIAPASGGSGRGGVSDVLNFEVPPAAAQELVLQLPAANIGGEGTLEFRIPAVMLRKQ